MEKELDMNMRQRIGKVVAIRYQRARKKEKIKILDEFIKTTRYNRAYASWLLRNLWRKTVIYEQGERIIMVGSRAKNQKGIRKRPVYYDDKTAELLKRIWIILDGPCGKRLAPYIKHILSVLEKNEEITLEKDKREKLLKISAATIDRLLREEKKKWEIKKKKFFTKPGSLLKHQIPVRTFAQWNENKPGFVEMDLVDHSGGEEGGVFAQSLDVTDVFTGWTETIAVKNKSQYHVFAGITATKKRFPFPVVGIDSDNGSEFINNHLKKYCEDKQITFTRAREYKKNDNCYVEQKNWSVVRRTVGYLRYETIQEVSLLNQIYNRLRLYTNYFQPQMKCKGKLRIGSKVKKSYDVPKTPYQRILECEYIGENIKKNLKSIYSSLNPVQLKKEIVHLQGRLYNIATKNPLYHRKKEPESEPAFK